MGTAAIAALITGAIGLIGGIVSNAVNSKNVKDTNKANQEINQSQLDYNSAMTQATWERDDNAHQREVADLKAAGLSPLAATGGMNTQAISAPSQIAMQAPQVDSNSMIQSLMSIPSTIETERHNKAGEKNEAERIQNQAKELELKAQQLDLENKKVQNEIEYRAKMLNQTALQLEETKRHNQNTESLNKLAEWNERVLEEVKKQSNGQDVPYNAIYDYEEYKREMLFYQVALDEFVRKIKPTSESTSFNKSQSGGINAGTKGQSTGLSTGSAEGESSYRNISEQQSKEWYAFNQKHKLPVYLGDLYKEYYGHSYYNKK